MTAVSLIVPLIAFMIATAMTVAGATRMAPPIATSPWLMPVIVGAAMALVSAALVGGEIVRRLNAVRTAPAADAIDRTASPARVVGWLALSAGYAVATPVVGFEWATVTFLVLALKFFGDASWRLTLIVAIAMALLVPFVFRRVFFALVP